MATTTTHTTYGVPVSLAIQKSNQSKRQQRYGLSYPLSVPLDDTVTGAYLKKASSQANYFNKSSGVSLIRNNLRQLLLTEKGSRVMLPDYGLDLKRYLFEPLDETTFFLIRRDILQTISRYFSIARPLSLKVFSDDRDTENNRLYIELTLQLMDESLDIFDVEVTLG
tara:strand:- start:61546 stop:62046 length:501 start_codon:yes stop_codon:yes gene_type:complete